MKNKSIMISFLLIFTCLIVSCTTQPASDQSAQTETISIEDDSGVFLEFSSEETFTSIASLAPSTTETVFWLESGDDLVLREDSSYYPEAALSIESIGSIWGGIPFELLVEKNVDLVIAPEIISIDDVNAMRELGLNVFYMKNPDSYEALFEDFYHLSLITGSQETYETKIIDLKAKYERVLEIIEKAESTPSVFVELDATDPTKPYTVAANSFIDLMINLTGGQNIASEIVNPWPQIDTEFLVEKNPNVILMADYEWGVTIESLTEREGYQSIAAVESMAIYPIYSYETSVPGPRMVDGLENMAKAIHPELFE